jgi:hypothetical protein
MSKCDLAPGRTSSLLEQMTEVRLTLVLGQYAQAYHLGALVGDRMDVWLLR